MQIYRGRLKEIIQEALARMEEGGLAGHQGSFILRRSGASEFLISVDNKNAKFGAAKKAKVFKTKADANEAKQKVSDVEHFNTTVEDREDFV